MNGLIIVNKSLNYTSRDVVNKLTSFFGTKKIGHTGTLDPIATGVLVCLVGRYTKLNSLITALDKEYIAEIKLGIKTDTGDITGKIITQKDYAITIDQIKKVFVSFPKTYMQEVPLYSAVKIKGQKLYEYARKGQEVSLPQREVTIYNLELLDFHDDILKFKTKVSKGTYIRSLINDLCIKLKTVGCMASLIRTRQGQFGIEDAFTLEKIQNNNYRLLKIQEFLDYPVIEMDAELFKKIANGMSIPNSFNILDKVIFTYEGQDIAIYEAQEHQLKSFLKL